MSGTYEGLSVPIFGEFYRYTEGQVQTLFVEDNGIFNLSVTQTSTAGADNALDVTLSITGTAVASGYGSGVHVGMSFGENFVSSGGFASLQQNAFAADVTVNGTHTGGVGGLYVYMAEGTATMTSAQVYGGYFDIGTDFGTVDYLSCITLDKHNTTVGTTVDAFILCQLQGSGTGTSLIHMNGPGKPAYFLNCDVTAEGFFDITAGQSGDTPAARLAVRTGGSTMYLYLFTAS